MASAGLCGRPQSNSAPAAAASASPKSAASSSARLVARLRCATNCGRRGIASSARSGSGARSRPSRQAGTAPDVYSRIASGRVSHAVPERWSVSIECV